VAEVTFPVSRLPSERIDDYRRLGYQTDALIGWQASRAEQENPTAPFVHFDDMTLTRGEFGREIRRIAAHLAAHGIGPGDRVCLQGPNHPAMLAAILATWHLGAVASPIVGIYREHEVRELLTEIQPTAVVTTAEHRGFAHAEMFDDLIAELGLAVRAKVLTTGTRAGWVPVADLPAVDAFPPTMVHPDAPCLILLTSGSTGRAKAVVHSSRTLVAEGLQVGRAWAWTKSDVSYVPVTLAHITGLLRAAIMPVLTGSPVVLRSHWDAERAVRDVIDHGVTQLSVPGLLLGELVEAYEAAGRPPHRMRLMAVGVTDGQYEAFDAAEAYGLCPSRNYGMSELPTITLAAPEHSVRQRRETCGAIAAGVEVRVRDVDGRPLEPDQVGELQVRGPEQMLGYLDPAVNETAWTTDGWIRTGDLGFVRDGAVHLVGRLKDIINRGGEKLACAEIEGCLLAHPGVSAVAVVPAPDPRLGEIPAAFVVADGGGVDAESLAAHMRASGLAAQKVPAIWKFVDSLPRTESGKIRKDELRRQLWPATASGQQERG